MKKITIADKKILSLVKEKNDLVAKGKEFTTKIEGIAAEIASLDKQERAITDKVQPTDLICKGDAIKNKIDEMVEELGKIGDEIAKQKIAAIPEDMVKRHYALRSEKEAMEIERNKVGLKIQKIKSKVIPMIQKACLKDLDDEYTDLETAKIAGDKVVVSTFSHLENWKKSFKRNSKNI